MPTSNVSPAEIRGLLRKIRTAQQAADNAQTGGAYVRACNRSADAAQGRVGAAAFARGLIEQTDVQRHDTQWCQQARLTEAGRQFLAPAGVSA